MERKEVFNFSAGPSVIADEVLERAQGELLNYNGTGTSVMEMSHRSKPYMEIFESVKQKLKLALSVPDSYEVLFLQGGATLQFSMVPINLLCEGDVADYAITGNFSDNAAIEARKIGSVNIAVSSADRNHTYIPSQGDIKLTEGAAYFHYCENNTIFGTEWKYVPETAAPLVCDMSSNILSKPVDVSRYGIIYAGAQKNMAPAGFAVVIIDKSLNFDRSGKLPTMLSYNSMIETDSMYNTPPCYNIYMLGLTLDWLAKQGGVDGMKSLRREKSKIIYDYLDGSGMFKGCAEAQYRSEMNVTFRTGNPDLDDRFVKEAEKAGLINLKGHRLAGGMRASIYNAMPIAGVERLVDFMKDFEVQNNV